MGLGMSLGTRRVLDGPMGPPPLSRGMNQPAAWRLRGARHDLHVLHGLRNSGVALLLKLGLGNPGALNSAVHGHHLERTVPLGARKNCATGFPLLQAIE